MATMHPGFPRTAADAFWPTIQTDGKPNTGVSISLTPPAKLLTVSLDDSAIRLVAFEGKRIVRWTSIDMYEDDLAIPKAFRKYNGRFNRKVIDLPFYAPLARFMEKPEVKRRFMDQVVRAQTATTLPFDLSEVDIAWAPIDDQTHPTLMVTAVPKREVDAVVDLANLAGMKPSAMYTKAAALALAAGIPNAVVAHLSRDAADLVLVREDLAKTVHRVTIPGADDPDESASVLAQAIDELTAFEVENLNVPDAKEIDSVVLTGTMSTSGPIVQAVRSMLGRRIRSVSPRVWYPEGFPTSLYALNVGLAIADWSVRSSSWRRAEGGRMRATDLLPERHRVRVVPKRAGKLIAASAASVVILASSMYASGQAHQQVAALQTTVTALERQARVDSAQAARLNRDQVQVNNITQQIDALKSIKTTREQEVAVVLNRLNAMTLKSDVKQVSPMDINDTKGKITISATATSVNEALAYADDLRSTGMFTTVAVTDIKSSAGGSMGPQASMFSITVDLTYPFGTQSTTAKK